MLRETYSGSEVVLVAELIKLVFSGYLVLAEKSDTGIYIKLVPLGYSIFAYFICFSD